MTLRLRHRAAVNPPTPAFDRLADDEMVAFVPLEAVWRSGLDASRSRPKKEVATGYTRFAEGDIVIPKITPTFQADRATIASGVPGGVAAGTTELHVVRVGPALDRRFARYLFSTKPFLDGGEAEFIGVAGQKRVPDDWLRDLPVVVDDVGQQRAIADYLDAETARIDELIARKRRMIELLDERHRSFAVRHVLGFDQQEGRSASPSGLYPVLPLGWRETALRHLGCVVQTGPFGSQLHAEEYIEGGWPVVNPMNIVDGSIIAVDNMTISEQKRTELLRHVLRAGDIVFGRRGEMGRAGLVTVDQVGWLCGTGSLRLRLVGELLLPEYLKILLGSPPAKAYFELESVGSTMDNLNSDIVLGFPALVPSVHEQSQIVERVKEATRRSRLAKSTLEAQLARLMEHRQALITAAVTGDLAIPGVAA